MRGEATNLTGLVLEATPTGMQGIGRPHPLKAPQRSDFELISRSFGVRMGRKLERFIKIQGLLSMVNDESNKFHVPNLAEAAARPPSFDSKNWILNAYKLNYKFPACFALL